MCFICFNISGSINASNGTIFDVYLFSDCLTEIFFFCKTIPIHSEYARMKLHIGKTNPESLEEIHLSAKKRQQKVFFCLLFAYLCKSCDSKIYPTHLIPSAGAHG